MPPTKGISVQSRGLSSSCIGLAWTMRSTTLFLAVLCVRTVCLLTLQKPRPTRPFQEIAVDFCSYAGRDFLVLVDACTDWPDIMFMGSNTTTPRLMTILKKEFCRSGVPDVLWSDQRPQFTSKLFHNFTTEWGIKHVTSTPTYPQSNGKVEATVKSMKKLIQGSWCRSGVSWLVAFYSTGIPLVVGTVSRRHRSYLVTRYRMSFLLTAEHLAQSGSAQQMLWKPVQEIIRSR